MMTEHNLRKGQCPAAKYFFEVFMDFEPVGQNSKDKEEYSQSVEHQR